MSWNGVDLRNDIGVQIACDGEEIWRECSVCEQRIDLGDEVLYLFKQRGTASASSGYVHLTCMKSLRLGGQTGSVIHYGRPQEIHGGRCLCTICKEPAPPYVGLTKNRQRVGFHESCIRDVRLPQEKIEEIRAKRAISIPKKVIAVQSVSELKTFRSDNEELRVSIETRSRRDGSKLISAKCNISHWGKDYACHSSEAIDLFSHCKWQRKKGELRLNLIIHWPVEVLKGIVAYLDEMQNKYDEKGYAKVVGHSEKTF